MFNSILLFGDSVFNYSSDSKPTLVGGSIDQAFTPDGKNFDVYNGKTGINGKMPAWFLQDYIDKTRTQVETIAMPGLTSKEIKDLLLPTLLNYLSENDTVVLSLGSNDMMSLEQIRALSQPLVNNSLHKKTMDGLLKSAVGDAISILQSIKKKVGSVILISNEPFAKSIVAQGFSLEDIPFVLLEKLIPSLSIPSGKVSYFLNPKNGHYTETGNQILAYSIAFNIHKAREGTLQNPDSSLVIQPEKIELQEAQIQALVDQLRES